MDWRGGIKVTLLLATLAFCFFEFELHRQSSIYREFEAALLQTQWVPLISFAIWCGSFLFLTFTRNDLPLIGLLLIAITAYFIGYATVSLATDAIILLFGVTMGKGIAFFLEKENRKSEIGNFLVGLVVLLAFSSWWHLDMADNFYRGPRWMGLWNNPNEYGMLMGVGVTLAIGLLAAKIHKRHKVNSNALFQSFLRFLRSFVAIKSAILVIAVFMMSVGLFFSYSRGAWLGTAIGLLYLAKVYGKLKWKYVAIGVGLLVVGVLLFWGRTPDSSPWYVKRMDFSRPSAQHRVAAWKAGFEIMRDHPFGVGWNKAVETYEKNYSPPEGGAAALTMNSYLMLGTELGIPALLCFLAYVTLQLGVGRWKFGVREKSAREDVRPTDDEKAENLSLVTCHSSLQTACRAGALVFVVAFWFDGGLFDLPTASVFWVLLELGAVARFKAAKQSVESNNPSIISA